jgi:hypothetical protein
LEELERVLQALRLVAKSHELPWWGSIYAAQKAAESDDADQITQDLGFIADAIVELSNMFEEGAPVRLENALAHLREVVTEEISQIPDTGNIKWDAVFAVDALRTVWWRNTGRDAPAKALNPGSEFASYLRDGFGYLKVDASAVPAFRRWVAWCNATNRETKS